MPYKMFRKGEPQKVFEKLPKQTKQALDDYEQYCLVSANPEKVKDMKRNVLKFLVMTKKPIDKLGLKQLTNFLVELNRSKTSDYHKNDVKCHVQKFLRWKFKDWSERFNEFRDIKQNTNPQRKRPIKDKILSKAEVEKLVKSERDVFYKAFLITQYEGALRTKEVRFLKWDDLKEDGEFYSIDMFSTKTKRERPIVLKEAKFWIDKLKEEQRNTDDLGVYIFHAKTNPNKPIDKGSISFWFKNLTQKALGRRCWAYCLRHSRATEMKRLVKENILSKDNAIEMMGHSEKMFDKTYSHMDKEDVKQILKEQLYSFEEMPQEEKDKLKEELIGVKTILSFMAQLFVNPKHKFSKEEGEDFAKAWKDYSGESLKLKS